MCIWQLHLHVVTVFCQVNDVQDLGLCSVIGRGGGRLCGRGCVLLAGLVWCAAVLRWHGIGVLLWSLGCGGGSGKLCGRGCGLLAAFGWAGVRAALLG